MNVYKTIEEPVSVVAVFNGAKVKPLSFRWGTKEYNVRKVNLVHTAREGRDLCYFFSVIDNANYFKLKYNSTTLYWSLQEAYGLL
jgi:hypothetical protein